MQIPRSTLLSIQKTVDKNITPFISTYNPQNREVFGILKHNMEIFKHDDTMKRIMDNKKNK